MVYVTDFANLEGNMNKRKISILATVRSFSLSPDILEHFWSTNRLNALFTKKVSTTSTYDMVRSTSALKSTALLNKG